MKTNEELVKEFERRRTFSMEECQKYINTQQLNESKDDEQVIEVDDIFEYMRSLGYSTINEIKEKFNL